MIGKLKKNNNEGFTIIEVMIVLAIAGLILLIVFLAVPALQRNSRNTQRKSDVGRIGSAVTNVINNNNGSLSFTAAQVIAEAGTLGYYTGSYVSAVNGPPAGGTVVNPNSVNNVSVYTGSACAALTGGQGQGATSTGAANARSIAITYATEGGAGTVYNCLSE